jgi:electron transfer flavoprotein-quinone oxidoreductase
VDLVLENGRVVGVESPDAKLNADVTVAADGVLSFLAEQAGLREPFRPVHYAVGAKEVVELDEKTLDDRLACGPGKGFAQLWVGSISGGMFGGGFVYPNRASVSIGLVVGVEDLAKAGGEGRIYDLLDGFKARPEVDALIRGGETVEYSAHVIPEGGVHSLPRLFGDGILVAGDAAGLAVNAGYTVRGMDFALVSGALAAEAVFVARRRNDFSASTLSIYEEMLRDTFVVQELEQLRNMPGFMQNPRLFGYYPERVNGILEDLFLVGPEAKGRMGKRAMAWLKKFNLWTLMRDAWGAMRL